MGKTLRMSAQTLRASLRTSRQGFRTLVRTPRWTAVAVLSLALGIGANALVFSLVDAVLLKPFPYPKAEQLVLLWGTKSEQVTRGLSGPDLEDLGSQSRVFDGVAAFLGGVPLKLNGDDSPSVSPMYVDPALFSVLRVQPFRGRALLPDEDQPGHDRVAVLSYGLWVSRCASSPQILGRTIRLDGEPYTVVGVMPPEFFFPDVNSQLWLPLSPSKWPSLPVRGAALVHAVARLKAGVALPQAQAEVDTITRRLELTYPATDKNLSIGVFLLYRIVVGKYYTALWTLLGAVALVLLIACANVANLLLARAVEREKELAVRAALGASRRNILGHLLTESVMLALLGGGAGGLVAYWGVGLVRGLGLTDIPRIETTGFSLHVLAFTFTISLLTVLVFGLGPALLASRGNLSQTLARGGVTSRGAARSELRDLLVVGEVALALVLLIGAGLLVNSFVRLVSLDWGFRPDHLLVVSLEEPASAATSASGAMEYADQLLSRLRVLPAVQSAAMAYGLPMGLGVYTPTWTPLAVSGRPVTKDWDVSAGDTLGRAALWRVGPGCFRTLGVPILRGREFTAQDNPVTRPVVVISKPLADKLWPGKDPLGKELQLVDLVSTPLGDTKFKEGKEGQVSGPLDDLIRAKLVEWSAHPPREVVGVVGKVRNFGMPFEFPPALYISVMQEPVAERGIMFVLRTSGDSMRLADAVKAQIIDVAHGVNIRKTEAMEELVRRSIGGRGSNKILVVISVMFGSLGLLLATGGVYGVLSYAVSQRTQEFGVRMALGAGRGDLARLVMGHGLKLIVSGTALGLAGAWALTRLLANFLFGVKPTDPATFAVVVVLLGAVGLLACFVPTRRAARMDPAQTLRYE